MSFFRVDSLHVETAGVSFFCRCDPRRHERGGVGSMRSPWGETLRVFGSNGVGARLAIHVGPV